MEKREYSRIEIVNALNQLKLSHLEKSLFERLDSLEDTNTSFQNKDMTEKYLKGKNGNRFNRAEENSENSFFKLYNERDGIANYTFCGDAEEAIAKRVFGQGREDFCHIISGSYKKSNSVKVIEPGEIKNMDDYWEVTNPIKIALENKPNP